MKRPTILIPKLDTPEDIPAKRRRLARIICALLVEDNLLSEEVAMIFSIDPDDLSYSLTGPIPGEEVVDVSNYEAI